MSLQVMGKIVLGNGERQIKLEANKTGPKGLCVTGGKDNIKKIE